MTNILVIESRRIYSNSVFHFLTSTGVLIVRHACRGIRSMGRRKVEINCAPRDALSLFTCFYVFSFSEYFTMCIKIRCGCIQVCIFRVTVSIIHSSWWTIKNKREREKKKNLSRVLRRFCVQLYLSCGFYARHARKDSFSLLSKKNFRG